MQLNDLQEVDTKPSSTTAHFETIIGHQSVTVPWNIAVQALGVKVHYPIYFTRTTANTPANVCTSSPLLLLTKIF